MLLHIVTFQLPLVPSRKTLMLMTQQPIWNLLGLRMMRAGLVLAAVCDEHSCVASCASGVHLFPIVTVSQSFHIPNMDPSHAYHALESYFNRRLFHGFENETFYIEGSLTLRLHLSEFRRDCFTQFHDMRSIDPAEILGMLPSCQLGKFAAKKYLTIVHPRREESLFGSLAQRRQILSNLLFFGFGETNLFHIVCIVDMSCRNLNVYST